jgi:arylsulfatase A-like enzyme
MSARPVPAMSARLLVTSLAVGFAAAACGTPVFFSPEGATPAPAATNGVPQRPAASPPVGPPGSNGPAGSAKPNIVFVLTDDQRADTLWAMPHVERLLADRGVTFTNAFASNPHCCPSRASILTGNYSHTTGVYTNGLEHGSVVAFHELGAERSTIAVWLRRAGYRTGLFGKYLNHYVGNYVPPGWDRFHAGAGYDGPTYHVDGVAREYPAEAYGTTVLGQEARRFIDETPLDQPFFVFMSDNGLNWGDHRLPLGRKGVPYEGASRLPLVIRYDGLGVAPRRESRLVANVDIAPTLAALAGIRRPQTEGTSLVPLIRDRAGAWRRSILLEAYKRPGTGDLAPTYCGIRTRRYLYVRYQSGDGELYDSKHDPAQLDNVWGDGGYRRVERRLLGKLRELCRPTPPGYRVPAALD